jgi:uncharacterized circularly permuted ATP-grasp superfamily protein/uncharacterized alpha-E superfamily protein
MEPRYTVREGHWDEAFRPSGWPRRAWRQLALAIRRMGNRELDRRWNLGRQLIEANGVTYNIYGDPQGRARPWLLDPVPLVLDAAEWEHIEKSAAQRALLLNRILADLYSSQTLIRERLLPPGLVFNNPAFLRPCVGIEPLGGVHLPIAAFDLARAPDGVWWVIGDRTQNPSGMGYALENRLVSARTLPAAFDQSQVRPLAGFLEHHRRALRHLAMARGVNPRVVVLTPGPNNETYFEHSFLAHHWGFPLVEGADLTVRGDEVFLKTLAGLERVDVILRRVDDTFCDPLELRGDSLLGVPGLAQAARKGHVAIANPLGSGIAETPAFAAFLPGLCQHLLGESLCMPSIATWWCGQPEALRYVLDHLDALILKPFHPGGAIQPVFPGALPEAERAALLANLKARPGCFIAREQVALSTAPTRTETGVAPRHIVVRVFAIWDGQSYAVMPGGLTRVSNSPNSVMVSMQLGGGSKDTWVLGSAGEVEDLDPDELAARPTELPSRAADNLFWLGRYAERVEGAVRLVRGLLPCLASEADLGNQGTVDSAWEVLAALGHLPAEAGRLSLAQRRWHLERTLTEMVYDPARMSSIGWNAANIRRVAWPLKERLSHDTWRVLQELDAAFESSRPVEREQRMIAQMTLLDRAVSILSALSGLFMENSVRGHGWRFVQIGKRLERALQTTELLLATYSVPATELEPALSTLLRVADSGITYRSRYFTVLRPDSVLELLLKDSGNPRSLLFQLEALLDNLNHLPGYRDSGETPEPKQHALHALMAVRQASSWKLCQPDSEGVICGMGDLARQLKGSLYDISDALTALHFSHVTSSRLAPPV